MRSLPCIAALIAWCALAALAGEAPPERGTEVIERLEEKLGEVRTVQARFVQEKRLAMFKHKMIVKGRLAVENPGRIAWHVEEPVRCSMVIIGPELAQWDEDTDEVQRLRLDKNLSFKNAFQQLTTWFSGDYAELRGRYEVTVEQADPYVLRFVPPEDSPMREVIGSVRVAFRQDERYIEELTIRESSGDVTEIRFLDTTLNEPVPEDVWEVRPGD